MSARSVLFAGAAARPNDQGLAAPKFFVDFNLDQIVSAIVAGREEYNLRPFFYTPLHDADHIAFRHEVMRDLEDSVTYEQVTAFARRMQTIRGILAQSEKVRHPLQKQRWFLDGARLYCDSVAELARQLATAGIASRGLCAFAADLERYAGSAGFHELARRSQELEAALAGIVYCLVIQPPRVDVRLPLGEPDYAAEVLATYERFAQGGGESHHFDFSEALEVNHIEAQVLDRVGLLYPDIFADLAKFCDDYAVFQDDLVTTFDREIQFYLSYLEYTIQFKRLGLAFCYPSMARDRSEIFAYQTFDVALAGKLAGDGAAPICNEFHVRAPERIIVVSGPNQGGKTTFARTFGQLHYLASLGCPVAGVRARLHLFDHIFTHFEKREAMVNLRGKLQDDLLRIRDILDRATPDSIIVMNEIFTSTTWRDAFSLSKKIANLLIELDLYCVWVTFIDELAILGETTVSMVSTVMPDNPAQRTFKVLRRPPDGLAYAISIAEKYRLTYEMIKERVGI